MDGAGPPGGGGAGTAAGVRLRLPDHRLHPERFLGGLCRPAFEHAAAARVPRCRRLGRPRRLAATVGGDAGAVDAGRCRTVESAARAHGRARARRSRAAYRRLPALHPAHLEPLRARSAGRRRGARPQPAAAGPGADLSPTDALHGLCRFLGRLCFRHRRTAFRPARRRLGALVATVDDGGMGFPDPRHRAGLVVGVLRTRLGRLVVLGFRSRTHRSCPGWSARRWCTRWR